VQDFHDLIGPKIRNTIAIITKKKKIELNYICQKCNQKHELDAAHLNGRKRRDIIEKVLDDHKTKDGNLQINNIHNTINEIIKAHYPLEDNFLFLCKSCHNQYDKQENYLQMTRIYDQKPVKNTSIVTTNIRKNDSLNDRLCKNVIQSWKYRIGKTSIQTRKNVLELISKIEENFDCNGEPQKDSYYFRRKDNNRQFVAIRCNKNSAELSFRLDKSRFSINDIRVDTKRRWFFDYDKEGKISIIPENYELILPCLKHAYLESN
jgi:hypothetical protein